MLRRLMVVTLFGAAGFGFLAPTTASADELCQSVDWYGPGTFHANFDDHCVAYPFAAECSSGVTELGPLGYVDNSDCVPAA